VQMPGMDGFDVLRAVPKERLPGIVFVTAYEQHALRAFDANALDYLLKPLDDARFEVAVHRARELVNTASRSLMAERVMKLLGADSDYISRFTVRSGSRIQIVLAEDVDWIGAAGDYAELHACNRSHLIRKTMASLEEKLDPKKFLRIHRSRIVRADGIVELRSIDNREYIVKLSDGSEHRSSRTYAEGLEAWLAPEKN
jgi:two-component system, LytTR family, response regulator